MCGSIVLVKWYICFFLGEKISKEQPKTRNKNKNILMMSKHTVRGRGGHAERKLFFALGFVAVLCMPVRYSSWMEGIHLWGGRE